MLLAVHLGSLLAFFVLAPYTRMVHGFYRLAALMADARSQAPGAEPAAVASGSVADS